MNAVTRGKAMWRRTAVVVLSLVLSLVGLAAVSGPSAQAVPLGGPVILGGDDLTAHGNYDGTDNQDGWVYIEKAIANIKPQVTRVGQDGSIAALGSVDPNFDPTQTYGGDAGAAIASAAAKNATPVNYHPGDTEIETFFDDLRAGTVNPSIIWIAGDDASNDLGSNGGATALANNASTIGDFVNSGGGLMSHGVEYGWLGGVLPGVAMGCGGGGGAGDLELTTDGQTSFPGLTNGDVNAGPWHGCFDGDIGDLDVLVRSTVVTDAQQNPARVIIGGAAVTLPGSISLDPATATNPVGTSHTVTATVRNPDGSPKSGAVVSFSVTTGPGAGASGTDTTDTNGEATFTYTNNGTAGTDTIEASVDDGNATFTATAEKTWEGGTGYGGTPATYGEGTTQCSSNATYRTSRAVCGWAFKFDVTKTRTGAKGSVRIVSPYGNAFTHTKVTSVSRSSNTARFFAQGKWKGKTGYRLAAKVVDSSPDTVLFKIYKSGKLIKKVDKPVATGDVTVN